MEKITRQAAVSLLPLRPDQAHKGDFGRVLVVAGSVTMCGAGLLCAKSALLTGAGKVYWALPQPLQPAFAAALPEVITCPLPTTPAAEISPAAWPVLQEKIEQIRPSLIVVGPGLGQSSLLPLLLSQVSLPLVLDADALNWLAQTKDFVFKQPVILTPHPGEMARLLGQGIATDQAARLEQVKQLAQLTKGVCILKGPSTLVAVCRGDGHIEVKQNTTGSVALAKAGSGDVLAGIVAGLWAQQGTARGWTLDTAFEAACCGVYLHGLAGELAAQEKSVYGVLASDTAAHIGAAIRQILN